jgi:hypothetical protein
MNILVYLATELASVQDVLGLLYMNGSAAIGHPDRGFL